MIFNFFNILSKKSTETEVTKEISHCAKEYIETILDKAGFSATVLTSDKFSNVIYLTIEELFDPAIIIGRNGTNIMSFQIILKSFLFKKYSNHFQIFIDCNNYLADKIEKAQEKAQEIEKELDTSRKEVELYPMNSLERKAIHNYYKDNKNISTHSIGEGDDRRIVMSLNS